MVIIAVLELSKSPVLTVKNTKDYDFKIIPATINFNFEDTDITKTLTNNLLIGERFSSIVSPFFYL